MSVIGLVDSIGIGLWAAIVLAFDRGELCVWDGYTYYCAVSNLVTQLIIRGRDKMAGILQTIFTNQIFI